MPSKTNPKDTKTFTLHVTKEFYERVTQFAEANGMSAAELIRGSVIYGAKTFIRHKEELEEKERLALEPDAPKAS